MGMSSPLFSSLDMFANRCAGSSEKHRILTFPITPKLAKIAPLEVVTVHQW